MTHDHAERLAHLLPESATDDPHDAARRRRVEATRQETLTQGAAIARTYQENLAPIREFATHLAGKTIRRIVIVGCGDSWFSAMACCGAFERLTGLPTEAAQAFEFATYGAATIGPESVVIGISSSGRTEAVLAALEAARSRGAVTVGVTNSDGSPLAVDYDRRFIVHATRKGWPTQSSTATVVLLLALAFELSVGRSSEQQGESEAFRAGIARIEETVSETLSACDDAMRELAHAWAAARIVLFTGAGPFHAVASFGAAKVRELAPVHAVAFPLEEYHHYRSQKQGDPMFLVAADRASYERAFDTLLVSRTVGGRTVAIVTETERGLGELADSLVVVPSAHESLLPVVTSIPLHAFAYHFAVARFEQGRGYPGATDPA